MARNRWTAPVVVGVDEKAAAMRAVRWAAEYAARRGVELRLVHAVELPRHRAVDECQLTKARAVAEEIAPDAPVTVMTEHGSSVAVLIDQSATASLLVLGSRGAGGYTGRLTGATATTLADRGHCPIVVMADTDEPAGGNVLVGVDGTHVSDAAVEFAFTEASLRQAVLHAVHAYAEPGEATVLAERLAGCREQHPDVLVTTTVASEAPAQAMFDRAAAAQLIVVGGHSGVRYRSRALRSTGHELLYRAPCPVAVVRNVNRGP